MKRRFAKLKCLKVIEKCNNRALVALTILSNYITVTNRRQELISNKNEKKKTYIYIILFDINFYAAFTKINRSII